MDGVGSVARFWMTWLADPAAAWLSHSEGLSVNKGAARPHIVSSLTQRRGTTDLPAGCALANCGHRWPPGRSAEPFLLLRRPLDGFAYSRGGPSQTGLTDGEPSTEPHRSQ